MEEDSISSLPARIRRLILSYLETIDAVQTNNLSTIWRHLWESLQILDFDSRKRDFNQLFRTTVGRKRSFSEFIDWCFDNQEAAQRIKKLRLTVSENYTPSVNAWISNAINRNVEEIILSDRTDMDRLIPCLKVLHLVSLLTLESGNLGVVLSNSRVLEELKIRMDDCKDSDSLDICSGSLKRLKIRFLYSDIGSDDEDAAHHLTHHRIVTLETPELELLKLTDSTSEEFEVLQPANSLQVASLDFRHVVHFLNQISAV